MPASRTHGCEAACKIRSRHTGQPGRSRDACQCELERLEICVYRKREYYLTASWTTVYLGSFVCVCLMGVYKSHWSSLGKDGTESIFTDFCEMGNFHDVWRNKSIIHFSFHPHAVCIRVYIRTHTRTDFFQGEFFFNCYITSRYLITLHNPIWRRVTGSIFFLIWECLSKINLKLRTWQANFRKLHVFIHVV